MEEKLHEIHELIKALYPDAVCVSITVNISGIEAIPHYRTDIEEYSMRKINGDWVKRVDKP